MKKILFALTSLALLVCACNEKETNVPVVSVTMSATSISVVEGATQQLSVSVAPSDATNKQVSWSSTDGSIATVDNNGLVTGVKAGTANIVATAADGSGKKASCKVTVTSKFIPVTGLFIGSVPEDEIWEGETAQMTYSIKPDDATDKTVSYESLTPTILSVDANGKVTGLSAGKGQIKVTPNNGGQQSVYNTLNLLVKGYVKTITLDATEKTVNEGDSFTLKATVGPETAYDKTITWSSSDESIATVKDGEVKALSSGTVTITATSNDPKKASASCKVNVNGVIKSITFDCGSTAKVWKGETLTINAKINPETASVKTLSWKSSNETVATVDEKGVVTAKADGEAVISATATDGGGATASCTVTVVTKVSSITLDISQKLLEKGQTYQIVATVNPTDATNPKLVWKSSNEAAVTVDENGKVTAVSVGTATVTATAADGGGATASCTVIIEKSEGTEDYNNRDFKW